MHRLFVWFGSLLGRPRRLLIVLGICALVLAVSSPFLWAGYHWYAAQAALQRYHNAEARRHLNACLKVWPWSRSVHVHLLAARAARHEGDLEEAAQHLEEVQSTLGDQSPETMLEWAMLHAAGGDLDKVEAYLQDQARNHPQLLLLILEALAQGYVRVARITAALHCLEECLAHEPENVQALDLRGSIYRQSGAWPQAALDLRRVVELDPERSQARWWLAVALVNIGRYEEAAQHLEILRQHPPQHVEEVEILVRLAICRHRTGQGREARALLDAVLAQRPDHGLALLTRGQFDQMNGQLAEAEKWLRQAVRALPYSYQAHWTLTECLRQQGKTEQAEAEEAYANQLKDRWARLQEITGHQMSQRHNDPALHHELGKLMLELGMPETGKSWLLSALRLDEHYVPALTALADYYEKQGDGETAEEYRRRAQQSAARQAQDETRKANPSAAAAGGEHGKVP
jgi:tetratricopeptide (TPR) repeat protein